MGTFCSTADNVLVNYEINKINEERLAQLSNKFITNLENLFSNNMHTIIKAQSIMKGLIVRKKVKSTLMYKQDTMTAHLEEFSPVNRGKDTDTRDDEINSLFTNYPLLECFNNDEIELRPPVEYPNESIYYGEWIKSTSTRCGRGIQTWTDGSRYEGYLVNDKANIKGKLIHRDKDSYEGDWKDDRADGFGVYTHKDGTVYEGFWVNDKQHGECKEYWPDGTVFLGEYKNGKKNGRGKFIWKDGGVFEGELVDNSMQGMGKYVWADKRQYNGDWKNNKMDGEGIFTFPDGRKYQGSYKDDKKNGHGVFEWTDGRKYCGSWYNGVQHGEGESFDPQKNAWSKGVWKMGKFERWI
jgi:hypothetical protein